MNPVARGFVAIAFAAQVCTLCQMAKAQEPVKPDGLGHRGQPGRPRRRPLGPRRGVQRRAPARRPTSCPGMGKVHFPVTTDKPEAQAFINQGVAQLHSFYYFEAERSFRQAAHDRPRLRHGLLGHGDGQRQQRQAGQGVPQGGPQAATRKLTRRETALPRRPRGASTRKAATTRTGKQDLPARPRDDRPGVPRRPRRPRLAGDGHLAERRRRRSAAGRRSTSCSTRSSTGRADAPRGPPLPDPPLGRRQADPRREVGGALRQDRPRDRPRLAHARPHLHRAEALRRRRLPAGRLGPGRPRLHDPRPGHAVRDPQLRPQQPVARAPA